MPQEITGTPTTGLGVPTPTTGLLGVGIRRRTFSAMLEVLAGDVRRLSDSDLGIRQRIGIRRRISAALGVLPLVARRYLQSDQVAETRVLIRVGVLRTAFATGNLSRLAAELNILVQDFPLQTRGLIVRNTSPGQRERAKGLYRSTCMACHRFPDASAARPAPDLFAWAQHMSAVEFIARLLDGVHGTAYTSFNNPLSDAQIAALYSYFRHAPQTAETKH